ncbi:substrate-binding domain-containing protein [Paenibacillus sp. DMB20]|uniref:substrate-binding domain-containing protein n=1 Tax=Paenibacillus sp. DMB20 TaxID=1642570 RepID=UPI0009E28CB8|nr:substrate-binding domain-containing protein [Paenibacillus sp. DMB20]
MKRSIANILAAVMFLGITGCSGDAPDSQKQGTRRIDMIVKMNRGEYWKTVKMGAQVAAKEFDVELRFDAPANEDDIEGQIEMVENAIERQTDAIVLAASDYMELGQAADKAAYNGIPVISLDANVASARVETRIGANNYEAGQKVAERMVKLLGGTGKIGVVSFVKGAYDEEERLEGLTDYIARFPGIELMEIGYSGSDEDLASSITRRMIRTHDLDGIITLNSVSSVGAAREVKDLGLGGKVKLVTFDSTPEIIGLLQDGIVQATLIQNPFSNGYLAVQHAVEALKGNKVPEMVETPTKMIDLVNMLWPENQKQLFPFVR